MYGQIIKSQLLAAHGTFPKTSDRWLFLGKFPKSNPKAINKKNIRVHALLNYLPEKLSSSQLKKKKSELEKFLTREITQKDIIHINMYLVNSTYRLIGVVPGTSLYGFNRCCCHIWTGNQSIFHVSHG